MAIKAIIFDCFGVLVLPAHESLQHEFPHFRQELHDITVRSDYGFLPRAEVNAELSALTGIPLDEIEARYWVKNVRNQGVFEWVQALKAEGKYQVGLLSNIGPDWLDDFIPLAERRDLFDKEVLSGVVGITKPNGSIFQLMADELGVDTTECVMIDDLLVNIDGAANVGMHGIVYDSVEMSQRELDRIISEESVHA